MVRIEDLLVPPPYQSTRKALFSKVVVDGTL
jgi:hypothetical protein